MIEFIANTVINHPLVCLAFFMVGALGVIQLGLKIATDDDARTFKEWSAKHPEEKP